MEWAAHHIGRGDDKGEEEEWNYVEFTLLLKLHETIRKLAQRHSRMRSLAARTAPPPPQKALAVELLLSV